MKKIAEHLKPLILVTNDDGVYAPGLRQLHEGMKQIGQAIIVAPDRDNSAVSHSLTLDRPLMVRELAGDIFTLNGTPADCVTIALEKILPKKPDLVVSGINPGANLGHDISYSGTVSAAKEGTIRGVPSMALSMSGDAPFFFETAVECAKNICAFILAEGLPKACYLNINVPNLKPADISGLKFTTQGRRIYENALQEMSDPWGKPCFWIGGGNPSKDRKEETDSVEIAEGYISVTPIHLDLTNYEALDMLRKTWEK